MPRRALYLIISFLQFIPGLAIAQERALTLEQAVARALSRAPEIQSALEAEVAASSRVDQARSAYLPKFSAEAAYAFHWPKNELPIQLPNTPGMPTIGDIDDYHRARIGAQVALRLLDFSRGSRLEAAQSALSSEQAKSLETAVGIGYQVRVIFLTALFARDAKKISDESLQLALAEEKRANLKAEVGTGSQVALAQARVRVASLKAQYRQSEIEFDRQRALLTDFLGLKQLPELSGNLDELTGPVAPSPLEKSPTLKRIRATRQATELNSQSIARTFAPSLSLMAKADYEYPHAMKNEWGPLYQGGVTLSWDIFDGSLRQSQVREAKAQARSLDHGERATTEQLRRKIIEVMAKERAAQADVISAQDTLAQSEVYLRVARAAVAAGTGTDLDVHNAELGVDRARIAEKQALLVKALARAELLWVYGVAEENRRVQ